jgi:hypothetical protein
MENIMNIFERASRAMIRFESPIGLLTTEQLWDLPLLAKTGKADLDNVARLISQELKAVSEESFVAVPSRDPKRVELELKLDLIKHVIASKIAQEQLNGELAARRARKQALLEALNKKQAEGLAAMTMEDLEAELAKIEA